MGPEIFVTFGRYITDRTLVLDMGASIKSTELHAAQRAQATVAFEPDPVALPL